MAAFQDSLERLVLDKDAALRLAVESHTRGSDEIVG
jgi:hypothetical protein